MARQPRPHPVGDDLFSVDPTDYIKVGLDNRVWPSQSRFPVNVRGRRVAEVVTADLANSDQPLLVAGYSSIANLLELIAAWRRARGARPGTMRLLLGAEPFASQPGRLRSAREEFTDEIRAYWLDRSVSVRLSAKVIRALEELRIGAVRVRVIPGPPPLHAKIYVGAQGASVGSSNYTDHGLGYQLEVNARFACDTDPDRYTDAVTIAENLWAFAVPWEDEFTNLLLELLQVVSWQEALARACAELLEGDWVTTLLPGTDRAQLWPSQTAGIAQALWVVENLGSVLIADATGSGKTRMGAHLVAAVRHRLIDSGRLRRDRDLTTLVCPPAVVSTWQREALISGVTIMPVSHGLLSRSDSSGTHRESAAVSRAQVLAIDEAHNFLTATSNRTRHVRETLADHVLLFTATPISRGAQDLLSLVGLLGADNFEDSTLDVLERLDRGTGLDAALTELQRAQLRDEIQRFTVRRTKRTLNDLVDANPDPFRDPRSGRVCRYPLHEPRTYPTAETDHDAQAADGIRRAASDLVGIVQLGREIAVPATLRDDITDEQWLRGRLGAAQGLARHHVLAALRSSRAALVEHLSGTAAAIDAYELGAVPKPTSTGAVTDTVTRRAEQEPPTVNLACAVPSWLTDPDEWRATCLQEAATYRTILDLVAQISPARERAKASLLADLAERHRLLLAFDRRPITLAAIRDQMPDRLPVLVAAGNEHAARRQVERQFARDSTGRAIALCSDALNEGLNLQGASALVHLDLPTTLRVAEQRVGRVDRMDAPHDAVEVWWPDDGPAFATRERELLLTRRHASEQLLGSNLPMPAFHGRLDDAVPVYDHIADLSRSDLSWDGLHDALDPVRDLVRGPDALVAPSFYAEHRQHRHRVMARVAPVAALTPWAFLALSGTRHGAPRWLVLEGKPVTATVGVEAVTGRLRHLLTGNPASVDFDDTCEKWLDHFLVAATSEEKLLLPRRMQRALEQMAMLCDHWARAALRRQQDDAADQWRRLSRIAHPQPSDLERLDPYLVAEAWWDLVRPLFADSRLRRRRRYSRLRDLDQLLRDQPLDLAVVQDAVRKAPSVEPVDKRISAVILGVPADNNPA